MANSRGGYEGIQGVRLSSSLEVTSLCQGQRVTMAYTSPLCAYCCTEAKVFLSP